MKKNSKKEDFSQMNALSGASLLDIVAKEADNEANDSRLQKDEGKGAVHFTFICEKGIVDNVKAICSKEGVTIRGFMEYLLRQGIATYESKHGKATVTKRDAADIYYKVHNYTCDNFAYQTAILAREKV